MSTTVVTRISPDARRTRAKTLPCILPGCAAAVLMSVLAAPASLVPARAGEPLPTGDIVPGAPAKPAVPPEDPAVQAQFPGCAVWTDRCVTCEREAAGRISCSNIGIACQPQAVECVRNETAEEKNKKQDDKKQEN